MMRAFAICALAGLMTAGAAEAKPKPQPKPEAPSILEPAGPPPRPAEPARPKPPTLAELTAASEGQVRTRLGAPDVARNEGAGAFWTYRLKGCALFVFFRAEDGHGLRVSGTQAGPRRRGQSTPSVEACLKQFGEPRDVAAADDPIQAILDAPGGDRPQL
jgi:hypothetical protein